MPHASLAMAGHINSAVLLSKCAENKVMWEMAEALYKFIGAWSGAESAPDVLSQQLFTACCDLSAALEHHASQCNYILERASDDCSSPAMKVLTEGKQAAVRFSSNFQALAEGRLVSETTEKGAKAARKFLEIPDAKLPLRLRQCKAVLAQVELLEKLPAEKTMMNAEEGPDDFYNELVAKTKLLTPFGV